MGHGPGEEGKGGKGWRASLTHTQPTAVASVLQGWIWLPTPGIATWHMGAQHPSGLVQLPICQVATPLTNIWPGLSSVVMAGV